MIGIPHDMWDARVLAFIVLKSGRSATEEEIITLRRDWIAGYKCPRSVEFRTEPLPLSGVSKVLKNELRKAYWQGKERVVN